LYCIGFSHHLELIAHGLIACQEYSLACGGAFLGRENLLILFQAKSAAQGNNILSEGM
jgi:hypothetical protein